MAELRIGLLLTPRLKKQSQSQLYYEPLPSGAIDR